MIKYLTIFFSTCLLICCSSPSSIQKEELDINSESLLQAISIVDSETVWISGHDASFIRSEDGGKSWEEFTHPTIDSLQFRDIHAFSGDKVILMSAGPGKMSRIFSFESDSIWSENYVMENENGFLDCFDFWDAKKGIAYGDSFDEYPFILLTNDGGKNWQRVISSNLPKAGKGEGGFAASGTCVRTGADGKAWIATGASGNSRILITSDFGQSWQVIESPIIKGEAAGNTSISFKNEVGIVVGGDLQITSEHTDNCAFTTDGGHNWELATQPITKGAFYGSSLTLYKKKYFAFASGPNGIDYSDNLGQSWNNLDTLNYWAIEFRGNIGYASGTNGKVLKLTLN